jgi:hypothetical protein
VDLAHPPEAILGLPVPAELHNFATNAEDYFQFEIQEFYQDADTSSLDIAGCGHIGSAARLLKETIPICLFLLSSACSIWRHSLRFTI